MKLFTRSIVFVAVAILFSTAVFHGVAWWFGEDSSLVGASRKLVLESKRAESLRERLEMTRSWQMMTRSKGIMRDTIAHLISGRCSFRHAIIQFQKADELLENFDLDLIPADHRPTDPRQAGRQVLFHARNAVAAWPSDKAQRLLSEFESEYQTMFGERRNLMQQPECSR
jgi:hypothetical protein